MEPQTQQNNSILDKIEQAQALAGFVAMGVVMPFRRNVGLRTTRGIYLWPVVVLMASIGFYADSSHFLGYYAGAVLAAGLWQNYNRWQELHRGKLTHTHSIGVSPLAAIPFARFLPAKVTNWIISGDHVHRSLDPFLIFAVGLLLMQKDAILGLWIMFSGVSLRIFEEFRHDAGWNLLLDGVDSMLDGETQKAFMDHIRRGSHEAFTDPATGRQTTGAAEELAERIARNNARQIAAEAERRAEEQAHQPNQAHPFTEAMNRVKEGAEAIKEGAGAVKEAAEAVSAVREAGHAPTPETVIIDRLHTSDTLLVLKERTAYIPVAVEPEAPALTGSGPAPLAEPRRVQQLPAPPDEDEQDKAA